MDPIRWGVWIVQVLARALPPSLGCHRPDTAAVRMPANRYPAIQHGTVPATRSSELVLQGEDVQLVRPYVTASDRESEVRRQRERRRALWLAVHGIDVGPRMIHGMRVAG